ncbi:MAG: hypothetical protein HOP23_05100 [Methylococcaceae bacterium]|nr:hypothetical protein [Methylococcaceae bacterium]
MDDILPSAVIPLPAKKIERMLSITRRFWVLIHRYVGLGMTVFLIVVELTGSVLAFKNELDLWLNPDLLRVGVRNAPLLDPLVLREKAEASKPGMWVDTVPLHVEPGHSFELELTPRVKGVAVQELVTLPGVLGAFNNEAGLQGVYLDPYTGKVLGERNVLKGLHGRRDIVWFLYRLHMTLALPAQYAGLGARILGVVALVWTVDCFVSFYLTLPRRKKQSPTLVERVVKALSSGRRWGDDCMDAYPLGHKGGRATHGAVAEGKLEGSCLIDPTDPDLSATDPIPANALDPQGPGECRQPYGTVAAPPSLAVVPQGRRGRSWWRRWQPAWQIKFSAGRRASTSTSTAPSVCGRG